MTENLDVKARLSLENDLSPEMRRVAEDIKRFEKNAQRLKKSFEFPLKGTILDSKVLGEVQKELGQTGKNFNRLTKDQMAWAREQKRIGALTTDTWLDIKNHIDDAVKTFQSATGKKKKELAKQLKDDIGYARAFRYVYQGEHERYERAVDQHHRALTRLGLMKQKREEAVARAKQRANDKQARDEVRAAARAERDARRQAEAAAREVRRQNRLREREERMHQENMVRARRAAFRGVNRIVNMAGNSRRGFGPGLGSAVSAGGAVMAARSSIRASTTVDTEKAYAQIFQGMTAEQADKLYKEWAVPTGARMGIKPSELMRSTNEAVQQGVPEDLAPKYAELVTKAAKQLRMPTAQLTESFGPMMAQLRGQGRLKTTDDAEKYINLAVTMANQSAATRESVISAMRTGFGATDLMGMDDAHGMALMTTLIEGGSQGQQAARGVGHMAQRLANMPLHARNIRRKETRSAEDQLFLQAPSKLGFGSFEEISRRFKQNPNQAPFEFLQRFNRIKDVQERSNLFFALMGQDFARFELNVVKMSESVTRNIDLANKAMGEKPGDNALSRGFDVWLTTFESIQERIGAMWEPIIADLGDGFKDFAHDFMDVFGEFSKNLTGNLKKYVEEFGRGLIAGFGFNSLKDLLRYIMPTEGMNPDSFFKFGKGLAEGIKSVGSAIASAGRMIISAFGGNPSSPEALGKLVGQVTALVAALTLLSPVLTVFASMVTIISGLAVALSALAATAVGRFLLSRVGAPGAALAIASDPRSNSAQDITGIQDALREEKAKNKALGLDKETRRKLKRLQNYKTPAEADPLFTPTSYTGPTDFSGRARVRSQVDELSDQLKRFGGTVERAAFIGSTGSAFSGYGTGYRGGGGSGGSAISSVPSSLTPGGGGAYSLFSSTPGGALPNFGVGSGGIIRRSGGGGGGVGGTDIPAGGPADMSTGEGLAGNSFLAARRARFGEEFKNDPNLRLHLAAMQMTEGASRGGTIESLMNRTDMQGSSLRRMLGYTADGRINPRSFYGPIRRGELGPAIEKLKRNPKLFQYYDGFTQRALEGSHVVGGHTDQGLPTDPNGSARTGIPGLRLRDPKTGKLDGNEFTDWVGPGSGWGKGRAGAINYRRFIEQGISAVPSGADAVKNVPAPQPSAPMSGGFGAGGGGNVAIHINGNSHDPEALATLIQRRVDESMNWRTHDSESEYT
ncbi:TP901 family phage tail tape measure protein [Bradyrhizobium diazoefficiens]|uniref:phage tail tape measure protein n=1 Tax=Bradyrhizobium diazoefficiens TaxID=1355477 RepID=UPI003516902B